MISDNMKILARYRLEQADESIMAARLLLDGNICGRAVNSAYYAMFYSVLALLTTKKKETSKHGRVIGLFDLEYVKSGIFSKEFSKWLHRAFDLRQRCDYEPLFSVSQDDARAVIEAATKFVAETKTVIGDILNQS